MILDLHRNALLIFIRNPVLGKVKTRLAESLGAKEALRIYRLLLSHTRQVVSAVEVQRYLFYSDFIDTADEWPEDLFQKHRQSGGDLGDRMLHACSLVLQENDAAVIIGSDCPGLDRSILITAFQQIYTHDFVIGPAKDGGYYLLGMKQPEPSLFQAMAWSTDQVFSQTIARMERLGKSYFVLPALADIDEAEDWEQYGRLML